MRKTALAVAVAIMAAGLAPAAASGEGQAVAFATNIWPNVNFLDKSSRLALARASNARLRRLARSEAADQTAAANTLVAWMDSVTARPAAPRPVAGRAGGNVLSMPLRAAAEMTSGMADSLDGLETGRSVAIDGPPETPPPAAIRLKDIDLTSANANLDRLSKLSGRSFDALYKSAQADALMQLSTIYATYIQNGEDAGLRNFAVRQLPKVDSALATLRVVR